ncbi:S1C family serine protease [Aquibacillus kalidii]|uniref:S1C family serine protease n=1 Tax=Aquibacillus kalidii TaxID=2762597 RepID=UPI001644B325|nr:trypsin-like peptidase domain-containing protein [Aquibacillus kalidii]
MTKKHKYLSILITFIIVVIGIVSLLFIHNHWAQKSISKKNTLVQKVTEPEGKDLKSIIFEAQKNVVQIEAGDNTSQKIGSGFLYNNKGDIITNAHVVKGAEFISVKLSNAQTFPAAIVGIGDKQDIAVIRVPQLSNQQPVQVSKKFQAEIGNEVVAVGSPLGFQNSVTLGIISGINRTFSIGDFNYENVYQISANITHGNSGGPLIDRTSGKVIAINSAGTEDGAIGFSIPISNAIDLVTSWSDEIDETKLEYKTPSSDTINPSQFKKDANYIVNYFFESLTIRDYINAYALLGSELQAKLTYQNFRKDYIHVVEHKISEQTVKYKEDSEQVEVSLAIDTSIRKNSTETTKERWNYTFIIGYENDQLKVLEVNKTAS